MSVTPFYGRKEELDRLNRLTRKNTSSLVVVKGRWRIGKSRLIQEFVKKTRACMFTGIPPIKGETTAQDQRDYFTKQLESIFGIKGLKGDDWIDLFWNLSKEIKKGRVIVVFDEINWMGSEDLTFLGKLKSAWDLHFKNNKDLILILSGSMSSWIEKNILSSTGFMGRISLELTLDEMPLHVCNLFWRNKTRDISAFEKFKILSVTGGVPRYLEEIDVHASAEENIRYLAFTKGGLLVEEFDRIFSDLFSNRSDRYKAIVERLANGWADFDQICESINMEKGGTVSQYLDDLVETGYIARDYTWNLKNGKQSLLSKFRLKDNYLRFYLKYIKPIRHQIDKNRLKTPPAYSSIMGLQFENLVLHNFNSIIQIMGIEPKDVVYDSPYFQRATKTQRACQIDYMIQDKYNTLFVFEIKFYKEEIGLGIISEVEDKIQRINKPKNFSLRPVLIHVNGVKESVMESGYFTKIIDFSLFLQAL